MAKPISSTELKKIKLAKDMCLESLNNQRWWRSELLSQNVIILTGKQVMPKAAKTTIYSCRLQCHQNSNFLDSNFSSQKTIYLMLTPIPWFLPCLISSTMCPYWCLCAHVRLRAHTHTSSVKGSLAMATVNESNLKEPPVSGGCWGCLHCWEEDLATCNHKPSIQSLFSITQQVRIYCIMASALFNPDWHIGMR